MQKIFLKLQGLNDGEPQYEVFPAQVSSTEDILNNTSLLNGLFEFPEDENQPNETYFNKLSVPQHCDDNECHGICRKDFVDYYTSHPTLLAELEDDDSFDDTENTEIYIFPSEEALLKHLTELCWVDEETPINEVIVC